MKRSIALLLLAFTAASARAGSFGGPTSLNSSTETSAVGVYQATARGKALTGLIKFTYDSDGNPTTPSGYVFFIDGIMVHGTLDAAIMGSRIASILSYATPDATPVTVSDFQIAGGSFNANIDTSSANYFFKGNGNVETLTCPYTDPQTLDYISEVRNFKVSGQRTSTVVPSTASN